jgi:hypothetical protein
MSFMKVGTEIAFFFFFRMAVSKIRFTRCAVQSVVFESKARVGGVVSSRNTQFVIFLRYLVMDALVG